LEDVGFQKIDALLAFHYKNDPSELTDEQYIQKWRELNYCLSVNYNQTKNAMAEALAHVLNQVLSNE
jgi:hypothetical protein